MLILVFTVFGLGIIIAVIAGAVRLFTGEGVMGQLDYFGAGFAGVFLFAIVGAMIVPGESGLPFMFVTLGGALAGCACYHFYKEIMS